MKYTKIDDAIDRLNEISYLEGSELGEAWECLTDLKSYDYCFSRDFNIAVINEIFKQAEESHDNFEIVEEKSEFVEKHLRAKNE